MFSQAISMVINLIFNGISDQFHVSILHDLRTETTHA